MSNINNSNESWILDWCFWGLFCAAARLFSCRQVWGSWVSLCSVSPDCPELIMLIFGALSKTCSNLYKIIKTWKLRGLLHVQLNIKCCIQFLLVLSYNKVNFKDSSCSSISQKVWDTPSIWQIYKESVESRKCVHWGSVWQVLVLCRVSWSHSLAAELRNCPSLFPRTIRASL